MRNCTNNFKHKQFQSIFSETKIFIFSTKKEIKPHAVIPRPLPLPVPHPRDPRGAQRPTADPGLPRAIVRRAPGQRAPAPPDPRHPAAARAVVPGEDRAQDRAVDRAHVRGAHLPATAEHGGGDRGVRAAAEPGAERLPQSARPGARGAGGRARGFLRTCLSGVWVWDERVHKRDVMFAE